MQKLNLFQGSASEFSNHEIQYIGSGENTAYFVHAHHFSEKRDVGIYYAEQTDINGSGGFLYNVLAEGRFMNELEQLDPSTMEDYVISWYGEDVFDALVDDIQEKTDYDADEPSARLIATGLLTDNEREVSICDMLDDVNYGGWDGFKAEHKKTLSEKTTLMIPIDFGQYVDVGRMLYASAMLKFDDHHQKAQRFLSNIGLDGLQYTNFGNGFGSNDEPIMNYAIWNEDCLTIRDVSPALSNDMDDECNNDDFNDYRPNIRR